MWSWPSNHQNICNFVAPLVSLFVAGRLRGAAVPAPDQTQWEHPHLTSTCLTSIGRRKGQQKREADPRNGTVPWSSVPFNFWSKIISLSFACQSIKNIDFFQAKVQEIPRLMVFPKRTNNVKVIWYNFLIFAHWLLLSSCRHEFMPEFESRVARLAQLHEWSQLC